MNERIKQLTGKALDQTMPQTWYGISPDELDRIAAKLAELIVRECMDIAKRTGDNFGSADPNVLEGGRGGAFCVYQNIKNTFGVEE